MHEDLTTVITGEKAIPLVGVVPLDLAGRHAQTSRRREREQPAIMPTARMLGAVLRLWVRDAGRQLRYGRLAGSGRPAAGPGSPGRVAGGRPAGFRPGHSGPASHVRMVLGRDRVR